MQQSSLESDTHFMREGSRPESPGPAAASATPSLLGDYMGECRELVLTYLSTLVPRAGRARALLYDRMLDYPLREAKGLRPMLCIAACRLFGGQLEGALPTAAVIELYHNAFLIHDDVEDDSDRRRGRAALHREYGVPVAMNVGDGMLALCLTPLLRNLQLVGLGKSLRILSLVARMARETAEGQALELEWCRERRFFISELDYLRMVRKKTSHYTFVAPLAAGAMLGGAEAADLAALRRYGAALGAAFQIQDDVLNLSACSQDYGKDHLGDLWEGKHTLILLHMLRHATDVERRAARDALSRPRPRRRSEMERRLEELVVAWRAQGALSDRVAQELEGLMAVPDGERSNDDVALLMTLIRKYQSVDYARGVARRSAARAGRALAALSPRALPSPHRDVLTELIRFVVDRDH